MNRDWKTAARSAAVTFAVLLFVLVGVSYGTVIIAAVVAGMIWLELWGEEQERLDAEQEHPYTAQADSDRARWKLHRRR